MLQLKPNLTYIERVHSSCSVAILELCAKTGLIKNERIYIMCGSKIDLYKNGFDNYKWIYCFVLQKKSL
jgi:hypothetical protein